MRLTSLYAGPESRQARMPNMQRADYGNPFSCPAASRMRAHDQHFARGVLPRVAARSRVAIACRGPSQSRRYPFESISTSCRGVQAGGSAKPASSRSRSRLMIASTLPWRPSDTR